ncbi:MAG: homoserine dehydrogenase [Saprospiraceae bacterium]
MQQIGLFGFGCIGQGLHEVLDESIGLRANVRKIAIKHPNKPRTLDSDLFTTNHKDILDDPDIHLIVELIDDAEAAWQLARTALLQGKSVVSANKKMIAEHLGELVALQQQTGGALLYEGAVCGSIPILRNLEEYYDNDSLDSVQGIFNGSSNFILSKMTLEQKDYASALGEAQALGFAESDPHLDVAGYDAKYKLVLAAAHAFGLIVPSRQVLNLGISGIQTADLDLAARFNSRIRLVASARRTQKNKVALSVLPVFVPEGHPLHQIEYENNAVVVESAFSQQQLFIGKGAGGHPTGAAVLSDISARTYNYKYEYKKLHCETNYEPDSSQEIPVYFHTSNAALQSILALKDKQVFQDRPGDYRAFGSVQLGQLLAAQPFLESGDVFISSLELIPEKLRESYLDSIRQEVLTY